jgi:hypothetical protein
MCSQSYGTWRQDPHRGRVARRFEMKLKHLYRRRAVVAALIRSLEMYQRLAQGGRNRAVEASR